MTPTRPRPCPAAVGGGDQTAGLYSSNLALRADRDLDPLRLQTFIQEFHHRGLFLKALKISACGDIAELWLIQDVGSSINDNVRLIGG